MAKAATRGEQVIGRMPVVNIQDSERYFLLLLLLRKLGTVSFDNLKTVDGIVCNTFQQACKIQGLLEGDQHWYDTLNEAIQTLAPLQLRLLFAIICGFGEVNDIPELLFRYKDALRASLKILFSSILKIVDLNMYLQKVKSFLSIII
ncbi:hypothetical protein AVEN_37526-1 [Araneus ventricosus]|uniref:Uncharacterized protein n=1 Tax=Araneus ventricosus TaxID=182803 RepID=A0A4Y2UYP1_ARAVE|nr:hypothetical protein AVEN_183380-1 [Araneus ventricosus]GBO16906.1 hypothetical protein AVEN_189802-1 [Araneus ventricosus]GBO16911.1 hypothetical protein AVEN_178650-1 [Araneus ventricosus]GBO16917.1 hypothetical protein AVEN_37526-1 [Araneus ventricosus]